LTGQSIHLKGSEDPGDRQQSWFVRAACSIVVLALDVSGGELVVFATVALIAIVSVAFLLTGGSGSAYDQIGAGGIARDSEYAGGATAPAGESPAAQAEREREIRQMLNARSERLVRAGRPALDVDAELARLLADEQARSAPDAGLVAEVRALVVARNERRVRQGIEPLDVDAEVARTLEELGP
jgi:hypothetical protein